jgi:hypothetical protein
MFNHRVLNSLLLLVTTICFFPQSAAAYIGPGAGLSAIGTFLAVVLGVIIALFGFVWYPLKRLLRKLKEKEQSEKR